MTMPASVAGWSSAGAAADGALKTSPIASTCSGVEMVEDAPANAVDVDRRRRLQRREAAARSARRASPAGRSSEPCARRTPLLTRPSRRRVRPLGESCRCSARSHIRIASVGRLGQVHQHLVVAERDALRWRGRPRAQSPGRRTVLDVGAPGPHLRRVNHRSWRRIAVHQAEYLIAPQQLLPATSSVRV